MTRKPDVASLRIDELLKLGGEMGIDLPPAARRKELIEKIRHDKVPPSSHEGIMFYARKIKFEAELGTGTKGALEFITIVYPNLEEDVALRMARKIQLTAAA